MLIRPADADRDAAACAAIYAPYVRETVISFEEEPPGADEMRRRIERAHVWLVAERDEGLAGFAYASPHHERAAYRWAADTTIYLDPAQRGRGLGRRLYTELLDRLPALGLWTACAGITLPNAASSALHAAMGFEVVGTYRRIGYKAGAWHDVCWLQLQLRPDADGPPADASPSGAGRTRPRPGR